MIIKPRSALFLGILFLVAVCSFLGWISHRRIQRVVFVSGLAGQSGFVENVNQTSVPGFERGLRQLIVPERNEESFAWIIQSQERLLHPESRGRHLEYENAPLGRESYAPSPFRWWLGFLAWVDHSWSHRPLGDAVERAALYATPLLQGFFLVAGAVLVARRFGRVAAAFFTLGFALLYPWSAGFYPGAPDHLGLARVCTLSHLLFLVAGLRTKENPTRWFGFAGLLGGLGLWIDARIQVPVLFGISLAAALSIVLSKKGTGASWALTRNATLWRIWGVAGAVTVLIAYLVEYSPHDLGEWRLDAIHPLYGMAWLGASEGLAQVIFWTERPRPRFGLRNGLALAFAVVALAAVPIAAAVSDGSSLLTRDLSTIRLTSEPSGVVAASLRAWVRHDGLNTTVVATLSPLAALFLGFGYLFFRRSKVLFSVEWAVVVGPLLVALGFALYQLSWWGVVDAALLVMLVIATSDAQVATARSSRWFWTVVFAGMVAPGLIHSWPGQKPGSTTILSSIEAQELVERDLAHWLARRTATAGAVIYAPPHETVSLCFFGGFRGLGTFAPENRAGFGATLAIAAANTIEEAQALIQSREIRYLIVPSWDPFFDEFGALYLDQRQARRTSILIGRLRHLDLPVWLRPLPYSMPEIAGFENQSVLVFEVVDEQKPAVAASRIVEYLLEQGKLPQASLVSEELRRFPGDVSALTARAQVFTAREDSRALGKTIEELLARLSSGGDRFLPWDRRVNLAEVLAQADQLDLARENVQRCIKEIDDAKVRALAAGALFRLLVLAHAFNLEIADPAVRQLALALLPPDLRAQL